MQPPRKPPPPEVVQVLAALGRRMRSAGLTGEDIGRRLGWTGDYARQVLVEELEVKGIFTAEEAARLREKLEGAAAPPEE